MAQNPEILADGTFGTGKALISNKGLINAATQPAEYKPQPIMYDALAGTGGIDPLHKNPDIAQEQQQKLQQDQFDLQKQQQETSDFRYAHPAKSGKIICNRWHELGYMDDETARLDQLYGRQLLANDRPFMLGYLAFARHVVKRMDNTTFKGRILLKIMGPFVGPWSKEMAHRMDSTRKGSKIGSFYMWGCHTIFTTLGRYRAAKLKLINLFSHKKSKSNKVT
jgi:hypothetical protein